MGIEALIIGAAIATSTAVALSAGKGGGEMPSITAGNKTETAGKEKTVTEAAKLNKRLAASNLTKNWAAPTLGKPGLLGGTA